MITVFRKALAATAFVACATFAVGAQASTVLYFTDYVDGTDRMHQALSAGPYSLTVAPDLPSFTTLLSTNVYDVAVFFQQNLGSSPDYINAWASIAAHIAAGRSAIGADWSRTAATTSFGAGFTGNVNDGVVTVTSPALLSGISNPVDLMQLGWSTFSTGLTVGAASSCAATFSNGECAIVEGNGGRTFFMGFLNDTPSDGVEGTRLFANALNGFQPTSVPTPGTLALLSLGLAASCGALRRGRRRA